MSGNVGVAASTATVNQQLTDYSTSLRHICTKMRDMNTWINGQNNGLAYLASIGFSTVPTASNPGGISDAQYALNMLGYLNTMASIYYGTAAQSPAFNFDQELSQIWGGQ